MIALGLGSNLGDREGAMITALNRLSRHDAITVLRVSSLYETAPVGFTDQPAFLNAVAEIKTNLPPLALLETCLAIERDLGRVRERKWGPRAIDIDLLLYHDLVITSSVLTLPHPYLHERRFVLEPLAELEPDLTLPDGRAVANLLSSLQGQDIRYYQKLMLQGGEVCLG